MTSLQIRNSTRLLAFALLFSVFQVNDGLAQVERITKKGDFKGKGTVVDIQPGEITIARSDGKEKSFIIQDKGDRAISLDGNDYIVSMPCEIEVYGTLPSELLERGMLIDFKSTINRFKKTDSPIKEIKVVQGDASALSSYLDDGPHDDLRDASSRDHPGEWR